ncbi:putative Anti-phage defense ZorAB system ZorA [Gammaproteobacteria bacterium]
MSLTLDEIALIATAPANAWYLSGAIVVLALLAFINFRWRIAPLLTEMRSARALLEIVPDSRTLVSQLPELDANLGSWPLLGPPWREFRATLVLPEPGETVQVLATRDPVAAFQAGRLLTTHLNLRFYHAMPNMLVGIGILGTFMGLLFGIHVASKGLAASDIAVARGALQGLLSAAALKFSTSVAGLLTSLLFSWREKQWTHRFEVLVDQFTTDLEARLVRVTSEAIALSSLRAIARQEALLLNLPERIGNILAANLTPQLAMLAANNEKREAGMMERLERLSRDFSRALSGGYGGEETTRLATTLERVSVALETHTAGLRGSSGEIARELSSTFREGGETLKRDVAQTLTAMLGRLSTAIEEMTGHLSMAGVNAAHDLNRAASGMDSAGGRLTSALGGMETAAETFGSETERLLIGLREAHAGFVVAAAPLAEAAVAFRNSATRMEGTTGRVQETTEGLRATVSELSRLEVQVCNQWREYEERFTNLDAALANTFHEFDSGLSRTTTLVREWVEGLDRHTVSIVRELSTATEELRETVAEFTAILVETRLGNHH